MRIRKIVCDNANAGSGIRLAWKQVADGGDRALPLILQFINSIRFVFMFEMGRLVKDNLKKYHGCKSREAHFQLLLHFPQHIKSRLKCLL